MKNRKFVCLLFLFLVIIGLSSCGDGNKGGATNTHVHFWELFSDSATCKQDGIKTYYCDCGESKDEYSPIKDHDFNETTETCRWCSKYAYDFNISVELPYTVGWKNSSGTYYTKASIIELKFMTWNSEIKVFGTCKKTYDRKGEAGTEGVAFKVKIYCDTDDEVIGVISVFEYGFAVGQKDSFDEGSSISTSKLSKTKKYTVSLWDTVS